jgi:hypothetical protein
MNEDLDQHATLSLGMEVHDANGDGVGKIIEVNDGEIVVEKGFFFPKDYVIPLNLIQRVDEENRVVLAVPKEDLAEDIVGERSDVDLELAGSTTFDPTIAAGAGVFPQQSGIDPGSTEPLRDNEDITR